MVTIKLIFPLIAGIALTIAQAKENTSFTKAIGYFSLGLTILFLSLPYFERNEVLDSFIPYLLISIIAIHFFLGLVLKHKTHLVWSLIPVLFSGSLFLIPEIKAISYLDYELEKHFELFIIGVLASLTPVLTHLLKLLVSNLIIRLGSIKWAENEDNYLESIVSYSFIGGIAAFGNFLAGPLGLVIAAVFYLSSTLISQHKLGLKNDIMLAASGSLFLLVTTTIYLNELNMSSLDFLHAEVLEGGFIAGLAIIFYDLMLRLARFNKGRSKVILIILALTIPLIVLISLGGGYLVFERLGGVLSLGAFIISLALFSVVFELFKSSSFIGLQLMSIGIIFIITPYIRPVEQERGLDLEALGLSTDQNEEAAPPAISHSEALGEWNINPEKAKLFFELGPENGRTKGEFQSFEGSFNLKKELTNSSINVTLPVKQLTTYISPRDSELMGESYFHEAKYPAMNFTGKFRNKENDAYTVIGDFTMLGVTHEEIISVQLIGIAEKEGKQVLFVTGNAQIDRTKYGMEPSSKIGNIVDFEFEIELQK